MMEAKSVLIALLDDGIDLNRCPNICLQDDLIVDPDGNIRPRRESEIIYTDHGTTCARIIHQYAPDAEFCSLTIFTSQTLRTTPGQLRAALNWCFENNIPLIHLSAGTTQLCDQEYIRRLIARMIQQGQTIVAARSNDFGRYTVPACCAGVLGVAVDPLLISDQFYIRDAVPNDVQIFSSSRHDLSGYPWRKTETAISNSYAAPNITAKIHALLSNGWNSVPQLYRSLAGRPISTARMGPDFLSSALVFDPQHFLAVPELLMFRIVKTISNEAELLAAAEQEKYTSIVLIPPCPVTKGFWSELFHRSENRAGIVYAGESVEHYCQDAPCLFWDEGARRRLIMQMSALQDDIETPVVWIEPFESVSLRLLCKLRDRLTDEGYGCIAVTDYPRAYLYGLEYLPEGFHSEPLITQLCHTHCPDIVLCSFSHAALKAPRELQISFGPYDSVRLNEGAATISVPKRLSDNEVEEIVQLFLES